MEAIESQGVDHVEKISDHGRIDPGRNGGKRVFRHADAAATFADATTFSHCTPYACPNGSANRNPRANANFTANGTATRYANACRQCADRHTGAHPRRIHRGHLER